MLHETSFQIINMYSIGDQMWILKNSKELLTLPEHLSSPPVLVGFVLLDL